MDKMRQDDFKHILSATTLLGISFIPIGQDGQDVLRGYRYTHPMHSMFTFNKDCIGGGVGVPELKKSSCPYVSVL